MAKTGKVALEDGFQNELDSHLDPSVVDGRNTQWSLAPILFGNVHPLDWGGLE